MANPIFLLMATVISYLYGAGFILEMVGTKMRHPFTDIGAVQNRPETPDCLNDPALGNHQVIHLSKVKINYVENGDRSKPLMLFLHGFPEFWYTWRNQLKEFSKDYWVVAIDMRGYGDTDKPEGVQNYKIEHLVADVKEFITAMGRGKCTLVAHDWGGIVAWYFTLLEPQMIESYVIINAPHPMALNKKLKTNIFQLIKSSYLFFFQLKKFPELKFRMNDMAYFHYIFKSKKSPPSFTEDDMEAYKFTYGKPGAFTYPINYYRANILDNSYREKLQGRGMTKSHPQGLLLFGDRDPTQTLSSHKESVRMVKNLKFVVIRGSNHFAQWDDPVAVNREMRKFLSQIKSK